ncbi:MAG: cytochrome c biogenesis protein CcsA [Phycisphaerae bacterium]
MKRNRFVSLVAFVAVILSALAVIHVQGAMPIQQGSPADMPAGHPEIGPGSPAVNAIPSMKLMRRTAAIQNQNRTAFKKEINLAPLRILAVQNNDQVKTLASWASETVQAICGFDSIHGQDPLYTVLDMAFRPQAWDNRNCIFVETVPIREQLGTLVSKARAQRILRRGTVSPDFMARADVHNLLVKISSTAALSSGVAEVSRALETFQNLSAKMKLVPPAVGAKTQDWLLPLELLPNTGSVVRKILKMNAHVKPVAGYSRQQALSIVLGFISLGQGWQDNRAAEANQGIKTLAKILPTINPAVYPSHLKRLVELWYDRLFDGTLVGVFLYFISLTLFVIAAVGAVPAVRKPALIFFTAAVAVQALFMGVRWWLAGRIPIQNEFESVLGSAFVGCVIGLILEYWKKNNLFGLAMSFVGFLAMTACFVVPFVLGANIGANIGRVDGVLNTYWLYIHVNTVISSYALIAASFCLGVLYLLMKFYYRLNPGDGPGQRGGGSGTGMTMASGIGSSLVADHMGDFAAPRQAGTTATPAAVADLAVRRNKFLLQLDAANIVILQMGFWFLGSGIIFGAVWADFSWGRPWEWDPKETFALVTWLVYLIIVHLRFVTPKYRPDWTAWLSVLGFGVMMFNWIGVNFFYVGLHSYAT